MVSIKQAYSAAIMAVALLSSACTTVSTASQSTLASAELVDMDGALAGRALLQASASGVMLHVEVSNVVPGAHGLHLHTVGKCEQPKFTSAMGHLNPFAKMHGTMNPQGSHLGDLPNIVVGPGGRGTVDATLVGTRTEIEPLILDADGTALIIHAVGDDYRTDPSGNSGDRIVCGVFKRAG